MTHEPSPPADTMTPNDGPRLAPTNSEIAETANKLSALDGSTQPRRAKSTAPGIFSGTLHHLCAALQKKSCSRVKTSATFRRCHQARTASYMNAGTMSAMLGDLVETVFTVMTIAA